MRILIISDAWYPQINGVVRTLTQTCEGLRGKGHEVKLISPQEFRTMPCPTYPEIPLALFPYRKLCAMIKAYKPTAIHISTEGPLGNAARRWCLKNKKPFTTAYHTQFPEYIQVRIKLPISWFYALVRRFHKPSKNIMVPTPTIRQRLIENGFTNTALWSRGVDLNRFFPDDRNALDKFCDKETLHLPKFVYIGRVAVEKNIEAFLELNLSGTKWIIGDGPARKSLEHKYPEVKFLGAFPQEELPPFYRAADVFVFPSKTDTFGLVLLEAMACGTPVAAYPVVGPIDVATDEKAGVLDENLEKACTKALTLDRVDVCNFGQQHSWGKATEQFESLLHTFELDK